MNSREWADKDYYADLGVSSSASAQEIKKAYRKIARENHPDAKPGDKAAEERFKKAAEAYDVVGDPDERKSYDEFKAMLRSGRGFPGFGGKRGPGFPGGFQQEGFGFNPEDFLGRQTGQAGDGAFGDIFGGIFNRGGNNRRTASQTRGANVETSVTLDFEEAILGTSLPLQLTRKIQCTHCDGTGSESKNPSICPDCNGSGFVTDQKGYFGLSSPCTRCHGTGTIITDPCIRCGGAGRVTDTKSLTIRIPAGVSDGKKLRIKGQGEAGPKGTPNGDLLVNVKVRPDEVFTREGNNLLLTVPVAFHEMALGATITVPTLESKVRMKIPAGTASGQTLRLRGHGVPKHDGEPQGDLLVTLEVAVPKDLGPDASNALRAYATAEKDAGFFPRDNWAGSKR